MIGDLASFAHDVLMAIVGLSSILTGERIGGAR